MLLAAIEGMQKGKTVREEFLYKRVRCKSTSKLKVLVEEKIFCGNY